MVDCDNCGTKTNALKVCGQWKYPPKMLVVQLKRFKLGSKLYNKYVFSFFITKLELQFCQLPRLECTPIMVRSFCRVDIEGTVDVKYRTSEENTLATKASVSFLQLCDISA
jgi:ubiquitin C-terminal hydrolase